MGRQLTGITGRDAAWADAIGYSGREPFSHADLPRHPGANDPHPTPLRVGFVLWPSFTLLAFAGFVDALRLAADIGDRSEQILCRWETMTGDDAPVRASCGVLVAPTGQLADPGRFDFIVAVTGLVRGIENAPRELSDFLVEAAEAGVRVVGLCTGGIALGRAGLMKGRRCCIASYHSDDLRLACPDTIPVHDQLFVEDGPMITCSGGVASIDLATHLIDRHLGEKRAEKLTYHLQMDFVRKAEHVQNTFEASLSHLVDKRIRKAIMLMKQSLNGALTVVEMAERSHLSERQFERMFRGALGRTPSSVYRQLRLERGKWLLENTSRTITQIAFDVGFADGAHFARYCRQHFASTPSEIRRRKLEADGAPSAAALV